MPVAKSPRRRPISEPEFLELWALSKVMDKTSQSKPTIYRLMQLGLFPLPIQMPSARRAPISRSVAWSSAEVYAWMREQIENNPRGGPGRVAIPNVPWSQQKPQSFDSDAQP